MLEKIQNNLNERIIGKSEVINDILTCLFAGGHVLLEDIPGVGKTTLAKALASTIGCSFSRIQFTPDTLPSDICGLNIYNMKTGDFEFKEGALNSEIILADEINRTPPKTQSSLLEAMNEGQVTVDGVVHPMPLLFMVIATQNPMGFLGTYPLPEASMDRFMMRLSMGYPDQNGELLLAKNLLSGKLDEKIDAVCDRCDILAIREAVSKVSVKESILIYVQEMVELTRKEDRFSLGVSPRGMLALIKAAQAHAFLNGQDFVKPDDVKDVAMKVMLHRVVLSSEARIRKENPKDILKSIIVKARIPKS